MKRRYYKSKKQQQIESICFKILILGIFWTIGFVVLFPEQIKTVVRVGIEKMQNQKIVRFDGQGPFSDALTNKHNLFVYKTIYADKN